MIINAGGNLIIVTEVILRDFPMGRLYSRKYQAYTFILGGRVSDPPGLIDAYGKQYTRVSA